MEKQGLNLILFASRATMLDFKGGGEERKMVDRLSKIITTPRGRTKRPSSILNIPRGSFDRERILNITRAIV